MYNHIGKRLVDESDLFLWYFASPIEVSVTGNASSSTITLKKKRYFSFLDILRYYEPSLYHNCVFTSSKQGKNNKMQRTQVSYLNIIFFQKCTVSDIFLKQNKFQTREFNIHGVSLSAGKKFLAKKNRTQDRLIPFLFLPRDLFIGYLTVSTTGWLISFELLTF